MFSDNVADVVIASGILLFMMQCTDVDGLCSIQYLHFRDDLPVDPHYVPKSGLHNLYAGTETKGL